MFKFRFGIHAYFTTITYWSRLEPFSSLKYRWKECHADIFFQKEESYGCFASSPCSKILVWLYTCYLRARWGWGRTLRTSVGKHVRPEIWLKGYFFGADWVTQITQLGYLNRQTCDKGYIFTKLLNETVPERLFFTACHSKRGMILQRRDHPNSL